MIIKRLGNTVYSASMYIKMNVCIFQHKSGTPVAISTWYTQEVCQNTVPKH